MGGHSVHRSRAIAVAVAALITAAVGAFAGPAAAAPCPAPAGTYDTGGPATSGAVNDPFFPKQWGLQQIKAPAAWARGARGSRVTIAVVDTGVDLRHPD